MKFNEWIEKKGLDEAMGFVQKLESKVKKSKSSVVNKKPEETRTNDMGIKVGDIFYASWGYDQTNVDWYKVIDVTKTGKSVKLQEIEGKITSDGGLSMSGKSTPVINKIKKGEKPITKKIKTYSNEPMIQLKSYKFAYKWDGKPKRVSWYG